MRIYILILGFKGFNESFFHAGEKLAISSVDQKPHMMAQEASASASSGNGNFLQMEQ